MDKTPLQQLIERLNKSILAERDVLDNPKLYHPNDVKQANLLVRNVEQIISVATELLPVERDAIVDAYWAGINGSMNDHTEAENIPGTGIIKGIKVGGGADLYYSTKYGETDH